LVLRLVLVRVFGLVVLSLARALMLVLPLVLVLVLLLPLVRVLVVVHGVAGSNDAKCPSNGAPGNASAASAAAAAVVEEEEGGAGWVLAVG
jgi:hypothetical protein